MLTFANIDLTKTVHVKSLADGLVLGFATFNYAEGKETLYAMNGAGEFFTTGERKRSPTFRDKRWTLTHNIPDNAEFIGHYHNMK